MCDAQSSPPGDKRGQEKTDREQCHASDATGRPAPNCRSERVDGPFASGHEGRPVRSVEELISAEDAWPSVVTAVAATNGRCVILPSEDTRGECLYSLQVTTRSMLGALALHCGALLIDHGWVRLFGAGHKGLPSIAAANSLPLPDKSSPSMLVIGEDVLGGKFAVNGGALPGAPGEVNFWAPDTLAWLSLGMGQGNFVHWMIGGGASALYESLRWPGWEAEASAVSLDRGLLLFPPPCTVQGRDTSKASRRAVPRHELDHWLASLAAVPEGPVKITVVP